MIVLYSAALAVVISVCAFGRFMPEMDVRVTGGGTLVALFVLQAALRSWVDLGHQNGMALAAWSVTMMLLIGLLYQNRAITGMPLVLLGVMANLLVVVANDGMPIVRATFDSGSVPNGFYHLASDATHLNWLGDVLPDPTGRWLMSLGDLLLIVGAAAIVGGEHARTFDRVERVG